MTYKYNYTISQCDNMHQSMCSPPSPRQTGILTEIMNVCQNTLTGLERLSDPVGEETVFYVKIYTQNAPGSLGEAEIVCQSPLCIVGGRKSVTIPMGA